MTPLHSIGQWLRSTLLEIPLPAVRALFVGLLVALMVWVWSLPVTDVLGEDAVVENESNSDSCDDHHRRRVARQLKWVATVAIAVQIAIYAWL